MKRVINSLIFYSKIVLLIIAFTLTLYIIFSINDYYKKNIVDIFLVSIPLFLSLLLFVLSLFKDNVKYILLFNIASLLGIIAIIVVDYRTIFDKNMVLWIDSKMNFYYFSNCVRGIKIISYLIFITNMLLFIKSKEE